MVDVPSDGPSEVPDRPPPDYGPPDRPPPNYGPPGPPPDYAGTPPYYPPPGYGGTPPYYPPPGYGWPGPPTDPQGRPLAEFTDRATGFLIDTFGILLPASLLVGVAVFILIAVAAGNASAAAVALGILTAVLLLMTLPLVYRAEFVYRRGQTVGQRVAKVMVVDSRTGNRPTHGQAWARAACQTFVSNAVFGLGYWWALWDPQRRTLHDIICHTYVIKIG